MLSYKICEAGFNVNGINTVGFLCGRLNVFYLAGYGSWWTVETKNEGHLRCEKSF